LDLFHGASRNGEHDDEGDLALRARHLEVKPLVLMAEDLHVAALQAAPTDRAVVKPRAVADELDDAHRRRHITPRIREQPRLAMTFDARASGRSDDGRVECSGRKDHAVPGLQLEAAALALQDERDRAVDAVKD